MLSSAPSEGPRDKLGEDGERFSSPLWWEPDSRVENPCGPVDK